MLFPFHSLLITTTPFSFPLCPSPPSITRPTSVGQNQALRGMARSAKAPRLQWRALLQSIWNESWKVARTITSALGRALGDSLTRNLEIEYLKAWLHWMLVAKRVAGMYATSWVFRASAGRRACVGDLTKAEENLLASMRNYIMQAANRLNRWRILSQFSHFLYQLTSG